MIIKNIVLPNETYINKILNILCKNNISYVYIKKDKELHLKNYIFRFYINTLLNEFNFEELSNIISSPQIDYNYNNKKNYKQLKKEDYKKISKLINIIIKENQITNKKLTKQFNSNKIIYKKPLKF